jgi:hypothetical protein
LRFGVTQWTLLDLYKRRNQINFPVYQRGNIWSEQKKKLLIDSILRGLDIPKFYLQETENGWDCIDGQQRIRAIVGFFDENFTYKGKRFSNLTDEEKEKIEEYKITITEVEDIDDEEVRLLFIRLQLGIPVNSGEKLNAIKSNMGDFIKQLSKTRFIKYLSIPERRFAKEQVCAQICNNSSAFNKKSEFRNSKYEDLENLYRLYKDFDLKSGKAIHVLSILNRIDEIFGLDASEIRNRAGAVSIFLLIEEMIDKNILEGKEKTLKEFYINFLKDLQKEMRLGIDAKNRFLVNYQSRVIQAADTKTSIRDRHLKLKEAFDFYLKHRRIIGYD